MEITKKNNGAFTNANKYFWNGVPKMNILNQALIIIMSVVVYSISTLTTAVILYVGMHIIYALVNIKEELQSFNKLVQNGSLRLQE